MIRVIIALFISAGHAGAHEAAPCGDRLVGDVPLPDLSAHSLESVDALITTEGFMNDGVFRVRALGGKSLLLKVSRVLPQNLKKLEQAVALQRRPSDLGLAPRIHGVLREAALEPWLPEMRRLHPRFRAYIGGAINVGFLMDEVEHGWNPKSTLPPPVNSNWDTAHIAAQFKSLKASVSGLGIDNYDWQFLIDTQGKVWLIDFDLAFLANGRNNRYFLFDVYCEHVLERIGKLTGTPAGPRSDVPRPWLRLLAQ